MFKAMLSFLLLFTSCDAFVPPSQHHQLVANLHQTLSPDTTDNDAVLTQPHYSSYSASQITQAQKNAEEEARRIFDPFAMNALFVNVEERSEPIPCSISSDSPNSKLPSDLAPGALLRIGPNGASTNEGFLDGDGMVHCIVLPPPESDKDITYSSTYVDTKGRKLEREAANGKTFAGTLGAAPHGLPMLGNLLRNGLTFGTLDVQKDTCNTAMAISGKRVLALMEQAPPSEIKIDKSGWMRTVESFARLNGAVPKAPINGGNLGAHGRTDPKTGERVHVSYQSVSKPYVRVDTFTDDWKLKSSLGVDIPTPCMVHDCALTPSYTVIMDFPLTVRPIRMFVSNKFPVEYEPQNGARIGLTPRNRNHDETVWFDVEGGVVLHAANAYERDDGKVVLHAFKSIPDESSSYILEYTPSFLYEWILDPVTGTTVSERCLNPDVPVEFPICNTSGEKASTTYGLVTTAIGGPLLEFKTPQSGVLLDAVVQFALEDESGVMAGDVVSRFDLPTGWHFVSEPTIVEKIGGHGHYVLLIATFVPANEENKGDHIRVAKDGKSMTSQLLILDGDCISNGVVTSVDLPSHVNYGLHSSFVSWDIME